MYAHLSKDILSFCKSLSKITIATTTATISKITTKEQKQQPKYSNNSMQQHYQGQINDRQRLINYNNRKIAINDKEK